MIELCEVKKSYDLGASFAVENTSLCVARGEFFGLIGESGCGKTTTLKMINRLEEPSSGNILVNGKNIGEQDPQQLRRNIGYVFQGIGLFPHHSVAQNVTAVPELLGWSADKVQARCEQIMELVGLPYYEYGARRPGQLSGGQQQRVGVARALAGNPEIVLMDEPFGALDPITRAELQVEFKRIQQSLKLTVVMVTHDLTEALLLADRIAVMKDGMILQIGTPRELLNRPQHDYVRDIVAMPRAQAARLDELIRDE